MKNKKKQMMSIVVATTLGMTPIISPISAYAQDEEQERQTIIQNATTPIKETAPSIIIPQELVGSEGQSLQEIKLADGWSWVDEAISLDKDVTKYPARFSVDDVIYDYSNVEGYNAEGHYVERNVAIAITEQEPMTERKEDKLPISTFVSDVDEGVITSSKVGDVVIDEDTFPDVTFREWVIANVQGAQDEILTPDEINNIKSIDLSKFVDRFDIESLQGIEHFTELVNLNCSTYDTPENSKLKSLDVSKNTKLETLHVSNNRRLTTLNVKGADALKQLECEGTSITSLDVSNNKALEVLNCSGTWLTDLDVSSNTNLISLNCSNIDRGDGYTLRSLNVTGAIALETLDCSATRISDLDVSSNANLTSLICHSNTSLQSLNVTGAIALETLDCVATGIIDLDVSSNTNLISLKCYGNPKDNSSLKSLKVAGATSLEYLDCSNTKITNLDVSDNLALKSLFCRFTDITDLDVSSNINLTYLSCYYSENLKSLNVAGAAALETITCYDTGITGLDVSTNTVLKELNCGGTPLAYLNLGTSDQLSDLRNYSLKPLSIGVKGIQGDSFKMADKFAGIEVNKISNVIGATYSNGIMSNYSIGTPITYTYDCGTSSGGTEQKINVTLNLIDIRPESSISITEELSKAYDGKTVNTTPTFNKTGSGGAVSYKWEQKNNNNWEDIAFAPTNVGTYRVTAILTSDSNYKGAISTPVEFTISQADSSISITEDLNKKFDGKTVNATPTFNKTGSGGAVSYKWEQKNNNNWEDIAFAPTNAGTYRVTATLASDSNYKGAISTPVEFTISQATNRWTDTLSITGWTYGSTANTPTAKAKSGGTVTYTYSDSEKGTYSDTVPTNAGIWYVKAVVAESNNYTELESIVTFTISPKNITDSHITVSDIQNDKDVENLVIKDGDKELIKGTDYDVEKKKNKNEVTVTITFKGNYTGTITKTYTVIVDKPTENGIVDTGKEVSFGFLSAWSIFVVGCISFLFGKKKEEKE